MHIASRLPDRHRAVHQAEDPGDLGQPPRRRARGRARRSPTPRSRPSATPAKLLEAPRRRRVRAVGVHRDALVVTSRIWQTNATALRAGGEAMLVDSPYFPDELEAAAGAAEPGGVRAERAARHPRRLRPPARAARLPRTGPRRGRRHHASAFAREPGAAQRELRDDDDEHYVTCAPCRCRSARSRRYRCPAASSWATRSSSCTRPTATPRDGHRAVRPLAAALLVVGDYLSDVEIPMISARRLARRTTAPRSARLAPAGGGGGDGGARARRRRTTATPRCGLLDEDVGLPRRRWSAATSVQPSRTAAIPLAARRSTPRTSPASVNRPSRAKARRGSSDTGGDESSSPSWLCSLSRPRYWPSRRRGVRRRPRRRSSRSAR